MISINRFIVVAIITVISVIYVVFYSYYIDERQRKADLVLENIRENLSEVAYVISTGLDGISSVGTFKSLLNRKVANNQLIAAMMISYGNQVLLTTDSSLQHTPPVQEAVTDIKRVKASELLEKHVYEDRIRFFVQDKPEELSLFIFTNQEFLQEYFAQNKSQFFVIFGLIPFVAMLLLWLALRLFVTTPLEKLRQYAYYQSDVPKLFVVKELEYVRASMVQTFERLEFEKKALYRLARVDELSGLANRNHLTERLNWLIAEAARRKTEFALLFLDLDNFKNINDSLGHNVGDELLRNVAGLIQETLRTNDIVARVGGDEFVVVLSHYKSHIELSQIIDRIILKIRQIHVVKTHPVKISASAGVAFYPKDGTDFNSLMKNADIAMYEAKKSGRGRFKFFTEELHQQLLKELELDRDMQLALSNREFELYYQPKVDVKTGQVVGAEALIRWVHPRKGVIGPSYFIPSAEHNGFIVELGMWVLNAAVQQQLDWKRRGVGNLKISVNLSSVQIIDNLFEKKFAAILAETGVDANKIDIEITESILMENSMQNINAISNIRAHGVSISLDDFGTGYSSLAYLKSFPINTLKIDKSFLDDYRSKSGAIFIETIVKIAQTLGLDVVAEGVESTDQVAYLRKIGCDIYQGYYFSKPMRANEYEMMLANWR